MTRESRASSVRRSRMEGPPMIAHPAVKYFQEYKSSECFSAEDSRELGLRISGVARTPEATGGTGGPASISPTSTAPPSARSDLHLGGQCPETAEAPRSSVLSPCGETPVSHDRAMLASSGESPSFLRPRPLDFAEWTSPPSQRSQRSHERLVTPIAMLTPLSLITDVPPIGVYGSSCSSSPHRQSGTRSRYESNEVFQNPGSQRDVTENLRDAADELRGLLHALSPEVHGHDSLDCDQRQIHELDSVERDARVDFSRMTSEQVCTPPSRRESRKRSAAKAACAVPRDWMRGPREEIANKIIALKNDLEKSQEFAAIGNTVFPNEVPPEADAPWFEDLSDTLARLQAQLAQHASKREGASRFSRCAHQLEMASQSCQDAGYSRNKACLTRRAPRFEAGCHRLHDPEPAAPMPRARQHRVAHEIHDDFCARKSSCGNGVFIDELALMTGSQTTAFPSSSSTGPPSSMTSRYDLLTAPNELLDPSLSMVRNDVCNLGTLPRGAISRIDGATPLPCALGGTFMGGASARRMDVDCLPRQSRAQLGDDHVFAHGAPLNDGPLCTGRECDRGFNLPTGSEINTPGPFSMGDCSVPSSIECRTRTPYLCDAELASGSMHSTRLAYDLATGDVRENCTSSLAHTARRRLASVDITPVRTDRIHLEAMELARQNATLAVECGLLTGEVQEWRRRISSSDAEMTRLEEYACACQNELSWERRRRAEMVQPMEASDAACPPSYRTNIHFRRPPRGQPM